MIVLRGVEYCTGTPDNPCVMDPLAIDIARPKPRTSGGAKKAVGVAVGVTAIGVLIGTIISLGR